MSIGVNQGLTRNFAGGVRAFCECEIGIGFFGDIAMNVAIYLARAAEDDWQVVVVTVPHASQAKIREEISTSAMRKGMDVHSVDAPGSSTAKEQQPDVFISSAASASTVLDLVDSVAGGVSAAQVVDMDRDRLLTRFVESMQSPTASEKFFGQMLIVQRDDLKFNTKDVHRSGASPQKTDSTLPLAADKPVLVVLTSKALNELGPQGATGDGSLPVAWVL